MAKKAVKRQINIDILPAYIPAYNDTSRILLIYGGRGSGKSYFVAQKIISKCLSENGHTFLAMHKYQAKIRLTVFKELVSIIKDNNLEDLFEITTSPHEIRCKVTDSIILFTGLDDSEKVKSISRVTDVWMEEATNFTEEDFIQINFSVRGESAQQIILTFNPIDKKNWIYKSFWVLKKYAHSRYHTTYKDNPKVPGYDKQMEELQNNADIYKVYALGEWGERTETAIFTNWEIDSTISGNPSDYKVVYGGCDFGMNDPNTAVLVSVIENTIYIIKEYYRSGITGNDFINDLLAQFPLEYYYNCDSSLPSQIEEMRRAGIKALSVKKNKVVDGIEWMRGKKIKVHPSCKHTIEELELYQWRVDKEDVILNEPLDKYNHTIDAIRYALRDVMGESMVGTVTWSYRI